MKTSSATPSAANSTQLTFARHETFHIRDGWIYKGMQAVRDNPLLFYDKTAHHQLGMGINMFQSVRYWLQATNLVKPSCRTTGNKPEFELTKIGKLIAEFDPYLENFSTLWIIHLELASNRQLATAWYWIFNEFMPREFGEERLVEDLRQYALSQGHKQIAESSLKKDIKCIFRTYLPSKKQANKATSIEENLECPLASLDLMRNGSFPGLYRFHVGRSNAMPLEIFEYSLYRFQELSNFQEKVLSLDDLRWAPRSPGRLLGLDMASILEFIEELELRKSSIKLTRTAGLNLVAIDTQTNSYDILKNYYKKYEGEVA